MTFDIQESEKQDLEMRDGESFVTDSSLMFEKTKMLEFNSALDIFSEIDSQYFRTMPKRRTSLIQKQSTIMMERIREDEQE